MIADKVGYINVDALSPALVKEVAGACRSSRRTARRN